MATKRPLCLRKTEGGPEKGLVNLWSRKKIAKKAHAGRGQETKWEIPVQFTRWKMTHLFRCRSPFGCAISCPQHEASFRLGCKQGVACCVCCAAPMMIQLTLGIMNPLVMIVVAIVIAAEKLLPRPEIVARFIGIFAVVAGITIIVRILQTSL
jgi:hypothetical protein